jgi:hypothetical protein
MKIRAAAVYLTEQQPEVVSRHVDLQTRSQWCREALTVPGILSPDPLQLRKGEIKCGKTGASEACSEAG